MTVRVQQPEDEQYRINIIAGMDGDDLCACLYKVNEEGRVTRIDTLVFTEPATGIVAKYPGAPSLHFLEDDQPEEVIMPEKHEAVHHPLHYNSHPEGIEAYLLTKHENFLLGNVFKYLLRHGLKSEDILEDVNKALEYLQEYKNYIETHGEHALPYWRLAVRKKNRGEQTK